MKSIRNHPPSGSVGALALAWLLGAGPRTAAAQSRPAAPGSSEAGPTVDLAPEHAAAALPTFGMGAGKAPDTDLVRGLTEQRFRSASSSASSTSIGGYGEAEVVGTRNVVDGGERRWVADLPRFVVFVAHAFNERLRTYAELEVEHATACKADCPGEVEMEQAYVEWKIGGAPFGLRAGMLLVPMGITNQWHEPPIFHGVQRPAVETVVIPSTWHDLGAGVFGQPLESLRYELYALAGLDPTRLAASGLAGARQDGALAVAKAWAVAARVEVEPLLGVVFGASGYASDLGGNGEFYTNGQRTDLHLPLVGWDADARWRRSGLEWKVLFTEWYLPESGKLMAAHDVTGAPLFAPGASPVATRLRGAYVEAAYDVLRPFGVSHQLLPFARLEVYDTQSAVPASFPADRSFDVRQLTVGVSYRPIQQVVVKGDFQVREHGTGATDTQIDLGLGFMY